MKKLDKKKIFLLDLLRFLTVLLVSWATLVYLVVELGN